jgi:hypothetical protein
LPLDEGGMVGRARYLASGQPRHLQQKTWSSCGDVTRTGFELRHKNDPGSSG